MTEVEIRQIWKSLEAGTMTGSEKQRPREESCYPNSGDRAKKANSKLFHSQQQNQHKKKLSMYKIMYLRWDKKDN